MNRYPGRLIVLEGLDGAGTTSQTQLLATFFQQANLSAYLTAEPSQGAIGQIIRSFLKGNSPPPPAAMNLLFAADRYDHLEREIIPRLALGTHVVCDRYLLSSLVYQQTAGVNRESILSANKHIYLPDLTILLEVTIETATRRRQQRNLKPELYEADTFLTQAAALYNHEALLLKKAGQPIAIVDGNGTIQQVCTEIQRTIAHLFVDKSSTSSKRS